MQTVHNLSLKVVKFGSIQFLQELQLTTHVEINVLVYRFARWMVNGQDKSLNVVVRANVAHLYYINKSTLSICHSTIFLL